MKVFPARNSNLVLYLDLHYPIYGATFPMGESNNNRHTDIELFAGAGGLAIGLQQAGFFPANFYEIDGFSCQTLRFNVTSKTPTLVGQVFEGKAEEIDWQKFEGSVRLLAAGAPCQPFSLAGKHLAERDGRNLFPEVLRAVRNLRPAAVFLENVRGLARSSFQPYFEYILRQLECPSIHPRHEELWQDHDVRIRKEQLSAGYEPDYHVSFRLVDAADYGVPQHRQRVFIVATRSDLSAFAFPKPTHSKNELLRTQKTGEYWQLHDLRKPANLDINERALGEKNGKLPWRTVRDAFTGLPKPAESEKDAWMNHWRIPGAKSYPGHSGSRLDWPAKTIKAGVHGVPGGENTVIDDKGNFRYFTLRETARLQTFPDDHLFKGARIHVTRQIGNAVPCNLAAVIAKPLYDLIESTTVNGKGIDHARHR